MSQTENPAFERLLSAFPDELILAQVLVTRLGPGFELRHVEDRVVLPDRLRAIEVHDLRALAQKTDAGAFRPLKSAPNLARGWRTSASTPAQLEVALRHLYPGAVADWWAAQSPVPPVTNYRPFTERQTGMYRITTKLTDPEAAQVIWACCAREFCLKRRLWTVDGLQPDRAEEKSIIACLEPCAVLLEFARMAVRINQAAREEEQSSVEGKEVLADSLDAAARQPDPTVREADFASPANPRRIRLAMEKQKQTAEAKGGAEE